MCRCMPACSPGRTVPREQTLLSAGGTIASSAGQRLALKGMNPVLLRIAGIFSPTLSEFGEMTYFYDRDYVFRSDKFNEHFGFQPTAYSGGIRAIVESDYR